MQKGVSYGVTLRGQWLGRGVVSHCGVMWPAGLWVSQVHVLLRSHQPASLTLASPSFPRVCDSVIVKCVQSPCYSGLGLVYVWSVECGQSPIALD